MLENGWARWYQGHAEVDGVRLDLLRLRGGKLEGFPIGTTIVEKIKTLPEEEASKVLTALAEKGGG